MEGKIRLAVFGQKRLSREGGIEIVVKELCTRMAQNGCEVTCYNRAGHHVSGAEYDKTIEYDGIRQKVVPTIEKKGLAAEQSSHKTVFAKVPAMGQIWRDFGHAFSFASSSSRGMYPSPSYLIWMCCTRFPLDLFGAST